MKVQDIMANMMTGNKTVPVVAASKPSVNFSSVMKNAGSSVNGNKTSTSSTGKQVVSHQKTTETAKNNEASVGNTSSVKQEKEIKNTFSTEAAKGKETLAETEEVLAGTQEFSEEEDIVEAVELIENAIIGILEEDLQISEEDLNHAMEVLGLSYMDLLQPENLKQLVMQLQGTGDITEVLMDDDLSTMLTQVLQDITVENIAQETELSEQDVKQIMETMSKETTISSTVEKETGIEVPVQENVQMEAVQQNKNNNSEAVIEQKDGSVNQEDAQDSLPDVSVVKTVSEEKGSSLKEDMKQNLSKSDLAETMVNSIASSTVTETISADGTMTTVQIRQVVIQIVQQIKVVIRPEQTDMQMILHPENLGRLQLAVSSKNGIMTANFVVQNEIVRNALETQMQELKDAFAEQGLKVEAVEVTVSTFEFTQQDQAGESKQQPEQKKQKGNIIDMESAFLEEVDIKESEEKAAAAISGSGNNVNYIA